MSFGVTLILLVMLSQSGVKGQGHTEIHAEYFKTANLTCQHLDNYDETIEVSYWILPSGDILEATDEERKGSPKEEADHITLKDKGFILQVNKIDDPDFGYYFCIGVDKNGKVVVVRIGLNPDGPYFSDDVSEEVKNNAIIGAISAAGAMVVMIAIWIWCAKCQPVSKPTLTNQTAVNGTLTHTTNVPNTADVTGNLNGEAKVNMDPDGECKLDDNDDVYYIADGIQETTNKRTNECNESDNTKGDNNPEALIETLSTTDSGHYQSIGSLGRDSTIPTEAELDRLENVEEDVTATSEKPIEAFENDANLNDDVFETDASELYAKPIKSKRTNTRSTNTDYETIVLSEGEDKPKDIENDKIDNGVEHGIDDNSKNRNETNSTNTRTNEVDEQTVAKFDNVLSSLVDARVVKNEVDDSNDNSKRCENDGDSDSGEESSKSVIDIRF